MGESFSAVYTSIHSTLVSIVWLRRRVCLVSPLHRLGHEDIRITVSKIMIMIKVRSHHMTYTKYDASA